MAENDSEKRFCVKQFTISTFWAETKELLKIGWILSIFMLLEYSLVTTSILFCGRLGQTEMASAGMAQSIISVFCFMPGYGMVTVCNTYFSTGFSSKDNRKQIIFLHKALLLSIIVTLLCWAILINTESLLYLLKQDEHVRIMVGQFVRVYLAAVPALFASFVLSRFLQCRNHVMITMLAMLLAAVVNILLQYVFVIVIGGGISYSSGALVISQYVYLGTICIYMYRYENITVWSSEALEDWYEFTSIGVHGCLMVELEILVFEAGYFLCGTFDAVSVGVFGAVYILIFYTFMICSGVASALAIRIGYSLGVNESGQAKVSMQVAFILCWIYAVITSIVIFSCQNYIGYIFTNDKEVIDGIAKIAPLLIIFEISDLTSNIAKGAVQGCGRQGAGALIAFIAYYFIGLPLCVYLVLFQKQKAEGMWIGLCVGNGLQATFFLIYTLTINWEKEASLSQERIRLTRSGEMISHNSNAVLMGKGVETMLNDNNGIMLNDLNQNESEESPLVGSFHLNRRTIYVRMMNYGTALVVCVVGISIYLL